MKGLGIGAIPVVLVGCYGAPRPQPPAAKLGVAGPKIGFERVWSYKILSPRWPIPESVVVIQTRKGPIVAVSTTAGVDLLSPTGTPVGKISEKLSSLLPLTLKSGPAIAGFRAGGNGISACDLQGRELWTWPTGSSGVGSAAPCDLGQGKGEGIAVSFIGEIGFGGGGVTLLDGGGRPIWHQDIPGNGWGVTTLKGRTPLLAVDDGTAGIRLFDMAGNPKALAPEPHGCDTLQRGDLLGVGEDQLFGATTTESAGHWVRAFDRSGRKLWEVSSDPEYRGLDPNLFVGQLLGRRLLVHGDTGGDFRLYDSSGKRLGQWQDPERDALAFCLLPTSEGHDDLVVYSSSAVTAYRPISLNPK